MMKPILMLVLWMLISSITVYGLPESPHPYPNDYDKTERYSNPGAIALEVAFCCKTETEQGRDFIILQGSAQNTIGEFSGKELSGKTIYVEGDTLCIRLVTDKIGTAYGYRVESIRSVFRQNREPFQIDYSNCSRLSDRDLKDELYNLVKNHVSLGYTQAREKMFGQIDNVNGYVRCVYTGIWVKTNTIPDSNIMNTEHTWPKSLGAENEPAKSDLNHLFPTDSETNNKRANYPFGVVVFNEWSKGGSFLGKDSNQNTVFMPREDHRGNVARAMFYFAIRYQKSISSSEEAVLKKWHKDDPVDDTERTRNNSISAYQQKRNPFIDHPEYVDQINDF